MNRILFFTFSLILLTSCSHKSSVNNEILEQSTQFFQKALESESPVREEYFYRSASLLENLISKDKNRNGYIYYNAANGWLNSGYTGRAILNYRKAELRMPSNNNVRNNLNFARSTVQYQIDRKKNNVLMTTIFFIHYDISFDSRLKILIALTFASFFSASIYLFKKNKIIKNFILISSLFMIFIGVSVIIDTVKPLEGIIISKEITARKGDSIGYESSFSQDLTEGVEFKLKSQRNEWYFIELTDGRLCWIPASSAELID